MDTNEIKEVFDMKRLNLSILNDYDIPVNRPAALRGVQFGDDAVLLGLVDRLIDNANAEGADVGLAVVQPGETGFAQQLAEQDGMFTAFVRGEMSEKNVSREQVVQSVLMALDPAKDDERLMQLAADDGVGFILMHTDETGEFAARDQVCAALAARFLIERWRREAKPVAAVVCGESLGCAEAVKQQIQTFAREWRAGEGFGAWLEECRFFPALADCLVFRSSPEEAARLCSQMNYADAMIHLAEPYGLWAIQADEEFQRQFPLDKCGQVKFVDSLEESLVRKQRIFDAGLFAMAALGCLHGNETLAECMKDEPLRDLVGHALLDEMLPFAPFEREKLIPYIIECYERYGNPMNDNLLPDAARGLITKFNRSILPAMEMYARENFEPPKYLTVALSATIMLYADARLRGEGYETVVGQTLIPVHENPEILEAFAQLSSDMSPDSLAYAVLSDRTLWNGRDLREIDGLEDAVILNLAN